MDANSLGGPVELRLPADSRLLRLVRLNASGLASIAALDVDELDDLRIAVDEAVAALIEGGDGAPLLLRFEVTGDAVSMHGEVIAGVTALDADRLELSTQILGAVCDQHELVAADGRIRVSITKRRGARAG